MIDGVLTTCRQCGADVPFTAIRGVFPEDSTLVHTPWACTCGFGECFHMTVADMRAVRDTLAAEAGRPPQGYLTSDEQIVLEFRSRLAAVVTPSDLEALWMP